MSRSRPPEPEPDFDDWLSSVGDSAAAAVKAPADLLGEYLEDENKNNSVFTVADNKAKKVPVKIGFNDGTNIEIVSGVKESDSVILLGKLTLIDNQPVKVTEAK